MYKKLLNTVNIFTLLLLSLFTINTNIIAGVESLYEKIRFEPVWAAKDLPLKMKWQETREFRLPSIVKKKNHRIILRIQARINSTSNHGWNDYLSLWLNGRPIEAENANNELRLINRPASFKTLKYGTRPFMNRNSLVLFFAPDFKQLSKTLPQDVLRENFWYLLDITDLVDDIDMNILKIKCTTIANHFKGKEIGWAVLGDCEIGYIEKVKKQINFKKTRLLEGKTIKMPDYSLLVSNGNGFEIKIGDEQYFLDSHFSYPEGGWNKFIYSNQNNGNEKNWRVNTDVKNKSFTINAHGKYYSLTRSVIAQNDKILVEDKFTNLSPDAPVGIIVKNTLYSNSIPQEAFTDGTSGNPTVFLGQKKSGVGVVVNDDIFRLQLQIDYMDHKISFFSMNFGLRPKHSYSMKWIIYPRSASPAKREFPLKASNNPDYWDFINQVRKDWNVNFQVTGPMEWLHTRSKFWSTPWKKEIFLNKKIKILAMRPWLDFQETICLDKKRFAENWKKAVEIIRKQVPQIKLLVPVETTFSLPMPLGEIPNSPLKDSYARNQDGSPMVVEQWWPVKENEKWKPGIKNVRRYVRLKGYEHIHVSLEKGKGALKEFKEQCDFIFNALNADGVYLDLFGHGATRRPGYRYSYDKWDGYTVDIDPECFTITRKYTDLALISSSGQAEAIKDILAKGKIAVTNYAPVTREMTNIHINRFTEVSGNLLHCYSTHLYSPIGFGSPWGKIDRRTTKRLMEDIIDYLNSGVLYYYYTVSNIDKPENLDVLAHCFPFTPVELHSGWLIGKERIITCKPGTFGWHDMSTVKGYLFDVDGRKLPFPFKSEKIKDELVTRVELKPGQLAVLERILPAQSK